MITISVPPPFAATENLLPQGKGIGLLWRAAVDTFELLLDLLAIVDRVLS